MKLPDDGWRRWHFYRAKNERRRRVGRSAHMVTLFRDGEFIPAKGQPRTFAPLDCRLFENTEELVRFIRDVRYSMTITTPRRLRMIDAKRRGDPFRPAGKPRRIGRYISFDRIEQLDPAGALVIAAEFDRARRRFGARLPAVNVERWHPVTRDMLTGLGFFRLLEIGDEVRTMSLADQQGVWRIYPFTSDSRVGTDLARQPLQDLAAALGIEGEELFAEGPLRQLFRSMIDSIDNVSQHAYPDVPFEFPHVGRWWLTGAVDFENKRLTISLYDQGITIPHRLRLFADKVNDAARKGIQRLIRNQATDSELIEYAVINQITTTGDALRGQGLGKLVQFVDACQTGELRILSRKGMYHYVKGGRSVRRDLTCSIGGTLISWQISL